MIFIKLSGHFSPGRLVATHGVLEAVPREELLAAYNRHLHCDWGDLSAGDWRMNDEAVESGGRIFSAYYTSNGVKFWIITDADRLYTTILLPSEY